MRGMSAKRRIEKVEFPGASGAKLAARLDRPTGNARAHALFAHCFTCGKDVFAASRIAAGLAERGIAVLRFDFTGLGMSEGEFANTNFSSNVDDLVAAADWLREHRETPAILIGHSLGGAAVLAAAGRIDEVRAVATIAAPFEPVHVRKLLQSSVPQIEAEGEAEVKLAGRTFRIRKQFLDDIERQPMERAIRELDRALLVLHSPVDTIVGVDNARKIFEAARHPKSFVSLDEADHLLGDRRDAEYVADLLASWSSRFLDAGDAEPSKVGDVPEGHVRVAESAEGKFAQIMSDGRHAMIADEPKSYGGDDRGPSPYELLLMSLGSCTTMTLRMYADRKEWPLERVTADLRHEKIHAEDCEHCETETGKIDRIDRRLTLEGPLDDAQRGRLLEIADRCPVHRTLHGEIDVRTTLEEGATARTTDGPRN